ncbi:MAG: nicotinamide riboside transporter PnuC [Marinilabiliaceae bacterium]
MINEWMQSHWMEIIGTFFALIYLYFSVRENIWLWVAGFVSSFLYLIVFYQGQLYADMGLQVYYLVISVYGWMVWQWGRKVSGRPKMPISKLKASTGIKLLAIGTLIYLVILATLLKLPEILDIPRSDLPFWDAFTTTGGILGTWMLARKILENWLVWIVVDLVSSGMYIYKGLDVTVLLYIVYTTVAVIGYRQWRRNMKYRDHEMFSV